MIDFISFVGRGGVETGVGMRVHEKPLQAALQRKAVQPFCCGLVAKEKDSEYNDKRPKRF